MRRRARSSASCSVERVQQRREHARRSRRSRGPSPAAAAVHAADRCCRRRRRSRARRRSAWTSRDLVGERVDRSGSMPYSAVAHQRLAGELQQDALERRLPALPAPRLAARSRAYSASGEAPELDHLEPGLREHLADRAGSCRGSTAGRRAPRRSKPLLGSGPRRSSRGPAPASTDVGLLGEDLALRVDLGLGHVARGARTAGPTRRCASRAGTAARRRPGRARARRSCSPADGRRRSRTSPSSAS